MSVSFFLYFCFPWIKKILIDKQQLNWKKALIVIVLLCLVQLFIDYCSSLIDLSFSDGFTKWFVYIFPCIRIIDFLVGCYAGVVYLSKINTYKYNNSIIIKSIFVLSIFLNCLACIFYTIVNPNDAEIVHSELWWRYTIIFMVSNTFLIYSISVLNYCKYTKLFLSKIIILIGDLSAYAFLIHQIVLRYIGIIFNKFFDLGIVLNHILIIISSFIVTLVICIGFKRIQRVLN